MSKLSIFHLVFFLGVLAGCGGRVTPGDVSKEKPRLFPDYVDVTIPSTIAPLNFKAVEEYSAIDAVFEGKSGKSIHESSPNYGTNCWRRESACYNARSTRTQYQ